VHGITESLSHTYEQAQSLTLEPSWIAHAVKIALSSPSTSSSEMDTGASSSFALTVPFCTRGSLFAFVLALFVAGLELPSESFVLFIKVVKVRLLEFIFSNFIISLESRFQISGSRSVEDETRKGRKKWKSKY